MPHFRYRAVTPAGEFVVGEVEAPSREEVIRRIEYLGHMTIEAELATTGVLSRGSARSGKTPRPRELTIFLRQLALLIGAGLTLEIALQTLGEDASKAVGWFAGAIRASIAAGDSFADALERHPAIIEPAHVAMVRAGEASGKLDAVLRAIVEDRTRRQVLAERISAAIRYPLFLIGSAMVVLMFFLIYVVPQFEPVFKDLGGRLNAGAAFVVAASTWLHTNPDLLLGTCLALILGIWLVASQPWAKSMAVAAFAAVPGIAGLAGDRRAARIIGTLGLLIENGVALPTALKILRNIVVEPRYAAATERVYEQVRNGRRFADALAETELLPPLAVRMLRIGDEMGDLALIARHAAEFYEHKFGVGLDRLMGAIGPVAIIVVSIVVGGLIVSIMTGLLSITELAT
ncbi:MAG TPA: type II secretion system F family protein [Xanthobacteraceae bacterium]|nr:type II secretion system F family protein [Xanthobacteraceae bacterium]